MNIEVNGIGLDVTQALREHTEKRFTAALNQHDRHVAAVHATLRDVNGPRGGVDKECAVQVKLHPQGEILVTKADADLYTAISLAAESVKNTSGRKIGRRKNKRN